MMGKLTPSQPPGLTFDRMPTGTALNAICRPHLLCRLEKEGQRGDALAQGYRTAYQTQSQSMNPSLLTSRPVMSLLH